MKTLGMIGGTTWVSTQDYYKHINKEVNRMLGGTHAARLLLYSLNFGELHALQDRQDTKAIEEMITGIAKRLAAAGVDGLMLCANTMHKYADAVQEATGLPLVHIADETAKAINEAGFSTVGLLGTRTTMSERFYKDRLKQYGIETLVPGDQGQLFLNHAIFSELAKDEFREETRQEILRIMGELNKQGAQGIILGCTEIPLIIKPEHSELPMFDTLLIHAKAGARYIVSE